ncbi:hypothetical protein M514_08840 [Trichuris suis]|uniref:GIY-YIG domain-containing protein n=1 Tax=Trichuris suis TaxID=68888 RepID=A0A085NJ49_9BILA|nr:hypothetical protein M514_08840 [Trichuris suis]
MFNNRGAVLRLFHGLYRWYSSWTSSTLPVRSVEFFLCCPVAVECLHMIAKSVNRAKVLVFGNVRTSSSDQWLDDAFKFLYHVSLQAVEVGRFILFNCNRELDMMPLISAAFPGSVFVRLISVDAIMSRKGGTFGVGMKFRPLEKTFFSTDVRVVELKLTTTLSNSWSATTLFLFDLLKSHRLCTVSTFYDLESWVLLNGTGLGEHLQRLGRQHGYRVYFKSSPSLRSLVRSDKIKLPFKDRPGVVHEIKCGCNASYIGETGNTLLDRFGDHMKALNSYRTAEEELNGTYRKRRGRPRTIPPIEAMEKAKNSSAVVEHSSQCSLDLHPRIICREIQFRLRQIKESLFTRNNPSINRDKAVEVSSIWTALISKSGCCSIPTDSPPQPLNTLSSE